MRVSSCTVAVQECSTHHHEDRVHSRPCLLAHIPDTRHPISHTPIAHMANVTISQDSIDESEAARVLHQHHAELLIMENCRARLWAQVEAKGSPETARLLKRCIHIPTTAGRARVRDVDAYGKFDSDFVSSGLLGFGSEIERLQTVSVLILPAIDVCRRAHMHTEHVYNG